MWQGDRGMMKKNVHRLSEPHHELMDMMRWLKLCKDCKLIDGDKLTRGGAEVVFAKMRLVGEFRVSFAEFFAGVQAVAMDHGVDKYDLVRRIVRTERPLVLHTPSAAPANRSYM